MLPGTEAAKQLGGDGTPLVAEFAAAELGALIGRGYISAANLIGNALDVRHRHPRLWAGILARTVRPYQASEVARRTRAARLTRDQARWVDAQIDGYLGSLAYDRFLGVVDAQIIAADPAAAEARRVEEALAQFVATGQSDEFGLKTMIVKANAGDVIFFVAMCDRIAACLPPGRRHRPGRRPPVQGGRDPRPAGPGAGPAARFATTPVDPDHPDQPTAPPPDPEDPTLPPDPENPDPNPRRPRARGPR